MMIAITGTPGTGKTGVCNACGLDCLDLNSVIAEQGFYTGVDTERGCLIADLARLKEYVRNKEKEYKLLVIEGHLAHFLNPEVAIVLRANPIVLAGRLKRKGFPPQKIKENVEAEMLDIILAEAVELCKIVYEVDTSGKSIEEVASLVREIIDAEVEGESVGRNALREKYKPGSVDWTGHLTVTMKNKKCKMKTAKPLFFLLAQTFSYVGLRPIMGSLRPCPRIVGSAHVPENPERVYRRGLPASPVRAYRKALPKELFS